MSVRYVTDSGRNTKGYILSLLPTASVTNSTNLQMPTDDCQDVLGRVGVLLLYMCFLQFLQDVRVRDLYGGRTNSAYLFESLLQLLDHVLFDKNMSLVQVLDDELMVLGIDGDNERLDGRIALDQHACDAAQHTCDTSLLLRARPYL